MELRLAKMTEWCEQQKDNPRVLRWLTDNPPPKSWKGSATEWAYTEIISILFDKPVRHHRMTPYSRRSKPRADQ